MSKLSKKSGSTGKTAARVDTQWILRQIENRELTQRVIAQALSLDPSSVSLLIRGRRLLKLAEAKTLAEVLNVPLSELLERFGLVLDEVENGPRAKNLKIEGWLDALLVLRGVRDPAGMLRGSKSAPMPFRDAEIRVARCQTAGTEFEGFDGALVYFKTEKRVDLECLGKLTMIKLVGADELRLRVIRRGYTAGKYNLFSPSGRMIEEEVLVEATLPVVWMKF